MALGCCMGNLFTTGFNAAVRKGMLIYPGSPSVNLFFIAPWINLYGERFPGSKQIVFLAYCHINLTKYPPSLDYLPMPGARRFLFLRLEIISVTGL